MGLNTGETIVQGDFINQAQKNATPSNDANKAPKLEADGRLSQFFTRLGAVLNCGETINGGTVPVPVYQNQTDNELYACDANDTARLRFIGFVTSNGTDGNPATFQGAGIVSGFTGLEEGKRYFVQDTVGTIGTTPGTNTVLVGVAISETQLLILRAPLRSAGSLSTGTTTGNSAISLPFRPSVIRIWAHTPSTADIDVSSAHVWVNGAISSGSAGNSATISTTSGRHQLDASNWWTFSISSVSDTGFTLTWTENNSMTNTVLIWEAEE